MNGFDITIDKKETEILMFALKRQLQETIENHIANLQGTQTNENRQRVFYEQNKENLELLKNISGLFPDYANCHTDIIWNLNNKFPIQKEKHQKGG